MARALLKMEFSIFELLGMVDFEECRSIQESVRE
jgi:hypothetical protein